jgi:exopolysaccharide biosynthesis polyprenyl glycosylphosphotransferase
VLTPRRHGVRVLAYFLAELAIVALSFLAAGWVRQRTAGWWGTEVFEAHQVLWLLPVSLVVWGAVFWIQNTYEEFRSRGALMHGFTAAVASLAGMMTLFAIVTILRRGETVNRSFIGLFAVTTFAVLFFTRFVAMVSIAYYTEQGYDRHYVIIGGDHDEAVALAETLEAVRGKVFQVRGFVTEAPTEPDRMIGRWKVLGRFQDIPEIAAKTPVDEAFLLPSSGPLEQSLDLIRRCESMGMVVHLRLAPFEKTISRLELGEIGGGDYLRFTTAPKSGVALSAKRILDVVVASVMLVLLFPLLLLIGLLVRLTSKGPAIFRQERAGRNGRVFTLFKFRTMAEGSEKERAGLEAKNEMDGPVFKIKDDPRVTGLGKFLRKTSIDELPQLWNVVKGDMSLVGPRPLPTYEVEKFEAWQRRRMSMRPGITCLWQVSGRSRVTSFSEWMKLDLEYVDQWSLSLDLKILLRTIPAVLGTRGAY